jgi:tetratricopeptide (TPR) repeat protein
MSSNKQEGIKCLEEALERIRVENENEFKVKDEYVLSMLDLSLVLSGIYLQKKEYLDCAKSILRVCIYMSSQSEYVERMNPIIFSLLNVTNPESEHIKTIDLAMKHYLLKLINETNNNASCLNTSNNMRDNSINIPVDMNVSQISQNSIFVMPTLKLADLLVKFGQALTKASLSQRAVVYFHKSLLFYEHSGHDELIKNKVAEVHNSIGVEYNKVNDNESALKFFLKNLEIRKSQYGENHLKTAGAYNNLGIAYDKMGNLDEAVNCWKKCMDIRIKLMLPDDIKIGNTFYNLGLLQSKMKNYDDATINLIKALNIFDKKKGTNSLNSGDCTICIGEILRIQKRYSEALKYLEPATKILRNNYGEYQSQSIKASILYGICLSKDKQSQKAVTVLSNLLENVKKKNFDVSELIFEGWLELGNLYEEVQDYEKCLIAFQYAKSIGGKYSSGAEMKEIDNKIFQVVIFF